MTAVGWSCSPVACQWSGEGWDRRSQRGTPRRCRTRGGGSWSGGRPKAAVTVEALTAEEGVGGTGARCGHCRLRRLEAEFHSMVTSAGRAEERTARRLSRVKETEQSERSRGARNGKEHFCLIVAAAHR
jgi:hypothetical protein